MRQLNIEVWVSVALQSNHLPPHKFSTYTAISEVALREKTYGHTSFLSVALLQEYF